MKKKKRDDVKFVPMGTKISPSAAVVWDAICQARQTDTYHMLQYFIYTMIKAAADPHGINPDIQKILTMLNTDAGWQKAFNLCAPNVKTKVAQVVLILEQEGKEGFGAVMIDKPFMSDARMTECVDDILERVCEVTMHGIYRRLRLMGARMDCKNLSDVLLTMIDEQTILDMDEESKVEMKGEALYDYRGRPIKYGARTKAKQHRTPDSLANDQRIKQQTIVFDDFDRETAEREVFDNKNIRTEEDDT